jgi:hypothetical protein
MFGYASFAQPTFAGLGSSNYVLSISEDFSIADNESVLKTLFASISEPILSDYDAEVVIATFFAYITENLNPADASTALASFTSEIIESVVYKDSESSIKTQYATGVENINLAEAPIGFAWIKINDSQTTQWVLIDNRQ